MSKIETSEMGKMTKSGNSSVPLSDILGYFFWGGGGIKEFGAFRALHFLNKTQCLSVSILASRAPNTERSVIERSDFKCLVHLQ